jgi:hypothetical protein
MNRLDYALSTVMFLLVAVALIFFLFFILATAGVIRPVEEDIALEQFQLLAGTEDVQIVAHSFYNWHVEFTLLIDGRPAIGECSSNMLNNKTWCSFTYMELYLPPGDK